MRLATPSNLLAAAAVVLGATGVLLPRLVPAVPKGVALVLVVTALLLLLMALAYWGRRDDAGDCANPRLRRRYVRELMLPMASYIVVLFASIWLLRRVDAMPLRLALALAPVVPIGFAVRAMVRYVRDTDEMQQRIELEAISIATAFVSLLYMTGGFLQSARLIQIPGEVAMIWVFPLVSFGYGIAKAVVSRRYR